MSDLTPQETRLWRALVRVDAVSDDGLHLLVTIPGWDANKQLHVYVGDIEDNNVLPYLYPNSRLLAMVNIGAEHAEDIKITNWTIP